MFFLKKFQKFTDLEKRTPQTETIEKRTPFFNPKITEDVFYNNHGTMRTFADIQISAKYLGKISGQNMSAKNRRSQKPIFFLHIRTRKTLLCMFPTSLHSFNHV